MFNKNNKSLSANKYKISWKAINSVLASELLLPRIIVGESNNEV